MRSNQHRLGDWLKRLVRRGARNPSRQECPARAGQMGEVHAEGNERDNANAEFRRLRGEVEGNRE